jgi:hypothetical protein
MRGSHIAYSIPVICDKSFRRGYVMAVAGRGVCGGSGNSIGLACSSCTAAAPPHTAPDCDPPYDSDVCESGDEHPDAPDPPKNCFSPLARFIVETGVPPPARRGEISPALHGPRCASPRRARSVRNNFSFNC